MDWREEAKELGVALYDKELKRPRKKDDILADIEARKTAQPEPVKITVDVKEVNKICSDALFKHVADQGLTNISCEKWFLNCKRKGIVFRGLKNAERRNEESESEETGSGLSNSDTDSERADSSERLEETVEDERMCCSA